MQHREVIVVDRSSSDKEEFEWEPEEDHEQVDAPDAAAAAAATLAAATTTAAAAAAAATTATTTATAAAAAIANEEVEVPDHLSFFHCPFTHALMCNPMMLPMVTAMRKQIFSVGLATTTQVHSLI